jgi:hypothetical protein
MGTAGPMFASYPPRQYTTRPSSGRVKTIVVDTARLWVVVHDRERRNAVLLLEGGEPPLRRNVVNDGASALRGLVGNFPFILSAVAATGDVVTMCYESTAAGHADIKLPAECSWNSLRAILRTDTANAPEWLRHEMDSGLTTHIMERFGPKEPDAVATAQPTDAPCFPWFVDDAHNDILIEVLETGPGEFALRRSFAGLDVRAPVYTDGIAVAELRSPARSNAHYVSGLWLLGRHGKFEPDAEVRQVTWPDIGQDRESPDPFRNPADTKAIEKFVQAHFRGILRQLIPLHPVMYSGGQALYLTMSGGDGITAAATDFNISSLGLPLEIAALSASVATLAMGLLSDGCFMLIVANTGCWAAERLVRRAFDRSTPPKFTTHATTKAFSAASGIVAFVSSSSLHWFLLSRTFGVRSSPIILAHIIKWPIRIASKKWLGINLDFATPVTNMLFGFHFRTMQIRENARDKQAKARRKTEDAGGIFNTPYSKYLDDILDDNLD